MCMSGVKKQMPGICLLSLTVCLPDTHLRQPKMHRHCLRNIKDFAITGENKQEPIQCLNEVKFTKHYVNVSRTYVDVSTRFALFFRTNFPELFRTLSSTLVDFPDSKMDKLMCCSSTHPFQIL